MGTQRERVALHLAGSSHTLTEEDDGLFATTCTCSPGARYHFVLDDGPPYADPCSRSQPDGVHGSSEVVDTSEIVATNANFRSPQLDELVMYELHVGTFTDRGTFDAAIEHFRALRTLGVRAIEVMPIATFVGARGWGYDGLYSFAPHSCYGGPAGFARFVTAAHEADLGVILDVVYNHLGPGSEQITAFGPYLTDHFATPWGKAIDYGRAPVRAWAVQNALQWVKDYKVDGLRLDATHAIFDDHDPHVLAELATRVHSAAPGTLVISEMQVGDLRPIEEWGHDAQWGDELHHAAHVLLTGEHDGYYEDYGRVADLARAMERRAGDRIVVCAQNHDQVGNRAFGDRLHGARLRLAAFCAILSPGTPLLFMGEEYDEQHPFQYFTDHDDQRLAEATRAGRRKEFESFVAFSGAELPDPQARATFDHSKLDREVADPETLAYYKALLTIRRELTEPARAVEIDEKRKFLRVRRGSIELVMNFSDVVVDGVAACSGEVRR